MLLVLSARVKWTKEESEALRQAVKECVEMHRGSKPLRHRRRGSKAVNVFCNLPWMEIARKFPTKTNDQCRRHWLVNTPATYLPTPSN